MLSNLFKISKIIKERSKCYKFIYLRMESTKKKLSYIYNLKKKQSKNNLYLYLLQNFYNPCLHKNGFHIFAHFIDNRKIKINRFEKKFSNREFNSHLHPLISRIENIFNSLIYLLL